jgi:hypothetical protein
MGWAQNFNHFKHLWAGLGPIFLSASWSLRLFETAFSGRPQFHPFLLRGVWLFFLNQRHAVNPGLSRKTLFIMETLETISAALKCTDAKKEHLKKAFDELQSHSSVLSAFSLTWSDLDAHFTSLQNSLTERFHLLESLELEKQIQTHCTESAQSTPKIDPCASQGQNAQTNPEDPSSPSISETKMTQIRVDPSGDVGSNSLIPPRPKLRALCESMDGKGLRKYVLEHPNEKKEMMAELPGAVQCAPDPAAMVLDAMEGFYGVKGNKEGDVGALRRSCVLLLEALMGVKANVGVGVRKRAKELALEWKGKASSSEVQNFEVMGFLHLVAAYGLQSEFDGDELVDCFVIVAQFRQAVKLCRAFGLGNKVAGKAVRNFLIFC